MISSDNRPRIRRGRRPTDPPGSCHTGRPAGNSRTLSFPFFRLTCRPIAYLRQPLLLHCGHDQRPTRSKICRNEVSRRPYQSRWRGLDDFRLGGRLRFRRRSWRLFSFRPGRYGQSDPLRHLCRPPGGVFAPQLPYSLPDAFRRMPLQQISVTCRVYTGGRQSEHTFRLGLCVAAPVANRVLRRDRRLHSFSSSLSTSSSASRRLYASSRVA